MPSPPCSPEELEAAMAELVAAEKKPTKCWLCNLDPGLVAVVNLWLRTKAHNHKRIARFLMTKTGDAAGMIYWRLRNHHDALHHELESARVPQ